MPFLFGPSLAERSQIVQTLRRLGPTSIAGLAAALSWTAGKTERLVRTMARRGHGGITFHAQSGRVAVGPIPGLTAPEARPEADRRPRPAPAADPVGAGPSPERTPSIGPETRTVCPTCRIEMMSTRTGEAVVCPRCGRLALAPSVGPPRTARPSHTTEGMTTDRRAQEMLASYVTSRPILCPRCRSPLRHAGVAAFRCPACGETVRFAPATPPSALARPPLPTPVPPAGPR